MKKSVLISVSVGVISYGLFAVIALAVVPSVFPYTEPNDELLARLTWIQRLVTEKVLNLGILVVSGMFLGRIVSGTDIRLLILSVLTAFVYQILGVSYIVSRWGVSYYLESHQFFFTLFYSAALCAAGTFFIRCILSINRKSLSERST